MVDVVVPRAHWVLHLVGQSVHLLLGLSHCHVVLLVRVLTAIDTAVQASLLCVAHVVHGLLLFVFEHVLEVLLLNDGAQSDLGVN